MAQVDDLHTDPYVVLGVPRDATADQIKSAYRALAMENHPDRNPGDPRAEERFKSISEAYATLRDPDRRAWVDAGRRGPRGPARTDFQDVDWQSIFEEADVRVEFGQGMPRTGNAVFDALFGAMTGVLRQQGMLPGESREVTAHVPFSVARTGGAVTVRVPGPSVCALCRGARTGEDGRPCTACGGRGSRRRGERIEVTVPPKVREGTTLRLRGLGGPGRPPGDAMVRVHVDLPSSLHRVGDEVHASVDVTPLEARGGVVVQVHGVEVRVPAGTLDGATVRVPGGGLAGADMRVRVDVRVWRGLGRWVRDTMRGVTQSEGGTA